METLNSNQIVNFSARMTLILGRWYWKLLWHFRLVATFRSHLWIETRVTVRKRPNWVIVCFDLYDLDHWHHILTLWMDITFVNGNKFHGDTIKWILRKRCDRRINGWRDGRTDRTIHRAAWSQLIMKTYGWLWNVIMVITHQRTNLKYRKFCNTPVTQDGDLAAICKIGQIAAGSLWNLIQRRGSAADRSKVSKVAEVAAKFWTCSKQAQWGRRGNRSS